MIAVDTNILVYSHREDSNFYKKSDQVLTELMEGDRSWAIPWPCIHEFFGVVTHPKIYMRPSSFEDALIQVECWLESPHLHVIGEENDYWPVLKSVVENAKIIGPKIHDAKIAAICIQNNVKVLYSTDRDFSRMKGLQVRNPLI